MTPEYWILLIWLSTPHGPGMSLASFESETGCKEELKSLTADMVKGMSAGRWPMIVDDYQIVGCVEYDVATNTLRVGREI